MGGWDGSLCGELDPFPYPLLPWQVVFLHPVHNFAFVAFDPRGLPPAALDAVRPATLLPGT